MDRAQYWTLNGVSLLLALLIGWEIHSVHALDDASLRLQTAQAPLMAAEQATPEVQRLLQRTAIAATRDPNLQAVLAKYGMTVTTRKQDSPEMPAATGTTTSDPVTSDTLGTASRNIGASNTANSP